MKPIGPMWHRCRLHCRDRDLIRWILSFLTVSRRKGCSPLLKPTASRWCGGFLSISSDFHRLPPRPTLLWMTLLRMPMQNWSIVCWIQNNMASAGRGGGWIWHATPTPMALKKTVRAAYGPIGIGWCGRSMRTCLLISSASVSLPATCCRIPHRTIWWPPDSTATRCSTKKVASIRTNIDSMPWWTA